MKFSKIITLLWFVPCLLGSIGIIISALIFLQVVIIETLEYDLWLGIFQLGLMLTVLDKGLAYLNYCFREFGKK